MSALGGIYNFDGAIVDPDALARLGRGLEAQGSEGGGQYASGSIGMVYRAFHANKESRLETQPFVSSHGRVLCWDGRLDNREELIAPLQDLLRRDRLDAAVVMAAYLKWGVSSFVRLVGDFSLTLWDAQARALYLVRDIAGVRPIYYHVDRKRAVWSTDIRVILDVTDCDMEIEEEYVAGFLTIDNDPGLTPYKNLRAVRPAHFVVITPSRDLRRQRYWSLDPSKAIRYKTGREYEDHFLELFRDSLRVRLRSAGPVLAELSGGLDSSAIVCMADYLSGSGAVPIPRLETVSLIFDESPASDEREFIRAVEQRRGASGHYIIEHDTPYFTDRDFDASSLITLPERSFAGYVREVDRIARDTGARTLLSGLGGDEIMGGAVSYTAMLADYVVLPRPLQLHRRLRSASLALKQPYVRLLWASLAMGALPRNLWGVFKGNVRVEVPAWYSSEFAERLNLRARMFSPIDVFGFQLPSDRDQAIGFLSAVGDVARDRRQEGFFFEATYPYLHRPLVEFMQAIPPEERALPDQSRLLMRSALKGILPETILNRRDKGIGTEAFYRNVAREWPRIRAILEHSQVCERGYVDSTQLQLAFNRARNGLEPRAAELAKTLSLELWLRSVEYHKRFERRTTTMKTDYEVAEVTEIGKVEEVILGVKDAGPIESQNPLKRIFNS